MGMHMLYSLVSMHAQVEDTKKSEAKRTTYEYQRHIQGKIKY